MGVEAAQASRRTRAGAYQHSTRNDHTIGRAAPRCVNQRQPNSPTKQSSAEVQEANFPERDEATNAGTGSVNVEKGRAEIQSVQTAFLSMLWQTLQEDRAKREKAEKRNERIRKQDKDYIIKNSEQFVAKFQEDVVRSSEQLSEKFRAEISSLNECINKIMEDENNKIKQAVICLREDTQRQSV